MKTSTLLIIGAVAVVGFALYEASKKATASGVVGAQGGTLNATTSSLGSSSGILTPILAGTGGLLNGIEAFINPTAYGTDVTNQIKANVQSNIDAANIQTTDTTDYTDLDTSDATMALYS